MTSVRERGPLYGIQLAILVILLLGLLRLGRDVLMPIALALLLNITLRPIIARLRRVGLPAPVSAGFVVVSLVGLVSLFVYAGYDPMLHWLESAPQQ